MKIQGEPSEDAGFFKVGRIEIGDGALLPYRDEIALGQISFQPGSGRGVTAIVFPRFDRIAAAAATDPDPDI